MRDMTMAAPGASHGRQPAGLLAWLAGLSLALLMWLPGAPARAADAAPAAADPVLEARMLAITSELRCLVCQNQTIADSHADLATDLREQVREMLQKGQTNEQIIQYMTDRYGDFVLYRPPFKATTALLWIGPGLLLVGALAAFVAVLRRRSRLSDDQFEPDEDSLEDLPRKAP
ncbi:MAG: cytochrome c-type biogenesis protein [Leptothrix sp. (in: b-proteobacteria)]